MKNKNKYRILIYSIILFVVFCFFVLFSCKNNNKLNIYTSKKALNKIEKIKNNPLNLNARVLNLENNEFKMPAPNYYEQKGYKLNHKEIRIINGKKIQLELLDSNNKKVSNVEWFVKTRYPYDRVYSKNDNDFNKNCFFTFPENGLIKGKENKKDNQQAEVWAKHNNHYYRAIVRGVHDDALDARYEEEINKQSDQVIENLKLNNLSDLEKVIQVNDWIVENVRYKDSHIDQTLYSAIIKRETVCTGYGKIFKHFMDKLGIPCKMVQGYIPRNGKFPEKHLWDLVEIDGETYHVDPTWNDSGQKTNYFLFLGDNDFSTNKYFRDYIKTNKTGVKYKVYLHKKNNEFADTLEKVEEIIKFKYEKFPLSVKNTTKALLNLITTKDLDTESVRQRIEKSIEGIKATLNKKEEYKSDYYKLAFNLEIPAIKAGIIPKIQINSIEAVKATQNEPMDHIKLTIDKKIELKKHNFSARFSLIDRVETKDNQTYEIYLKNPEYKGNYNEEISISKQNYISPFYNRQIKNLNVKIVEKPNAKIKVINKRQVLITNIDENIIYRLYPSSKWINATSNIIEINNSHQVTVELRRVDPLTKVKSDIQKLEIKLGVDPIVQEYKGEIVGVDESMEYKKEGDKYWTRITNKKISNLPNGKYIIRTAATETELPSNEVSVILTTSNK